MTLGCVCVCVPSQIFWSVPANGIKRVVHSFHLCGKINRQTKRQTNKALSFDWVHKPEGLTIFPRGADILLTFAKIYPQ